MKIFLIFLFVLFTSSNVFAASQPSGLNFPAAKKGAPSSDCEATLQDWKFAEDYVISQNNEYILLLIDRYGGKREFPDLRGTMCRVKDMYEMWPIYEMFPDTNKMFVSNDGKNFINGISEIGCDGEEAIERIAGFDTLIFYNNGNIKKAYKMDDLLPNWREVCAQEKELDWFEGDPDFKSLISEDQSTFTLTTSDGKKHYFNVNNGAKVDAPAASDE